MYGNLADNLADLNQVAALGKIQGKGLLVAVDADSGDLDTCQVENLHHFPVRTANGDIAAIDAERNAGNTHLNAVTFRISQHGNGRESHRQSEEYDENLLHFVYNLPQR